MVLKIYVSGISGNKEVKKRQQRVLMILDSKNVQYEVIDITEPGKEAQKEFMQANSNSRESKYPLPPQIFNEDEYCGDYEDFDLANENDELDDFLKFTPVISSAEETLDTKTQSKTIQHNGNTSSREPSTDKEMATQDLLDSSKDEIEDLPELRDDRQIKYSDDADLIDDKTEDKSDDQEKEE